MIEKKIEQIVGNLEGQNEQEQNQKGEKEMKTNLNNTKKVLAELDKVQEKTKTRRLEAERIYCDCMKAELKLKEMNVPKNKWVGVKVVIKPPSVTYGYAFAAQGTCAVVERFPTGWFITSIKRIHCKRTHRQNSGKTTMILPERTEEIVLDQTGTLTEYYTKPY